MNAIAKMLIDMAKFYDQRIEERQLEMYVEVLSKAPADLVLKAGREYIADSANTRFPIPPHKILDKYIKPPAAKDLARETAMRVVQSVSKFGYTDPNGARNHMGEAAWAAVKRWGSWPYLCQELGVSIDVTTFSAQMRDLLESQINLESHGIDLNRPALEQRQTVEQISSKLKALPQMKDVDGTKNE